MANTNTDAGAEYDADEGGRVLDCGPPTLNKFELIKLTKCKCGNTYLEIQMLLHYITTSYPNNVSLLPGKLPQINPNLPRVISMANTQIQTGKYQKTNTNALTGTSS